MTVTDYDQAIMRARDMRNRGHALIAQADKLEAETEIAAGVEYHDREPGFPCWSVAGLDGYYATPRQAIAAKEKRIVEVIKP